MIQCENTPRMETDRLILRRFTMDDLTDFYQIFSDRTVNTFLPWFPFSTMEEAEEALVDRLLPYYQRDLAYFYAIEEKASGRVVGYVDLLGIKDDRGDLGYGLLPAYWHSGIMTEAAHALLARAKENGFRSITATHDVNNPRSGAVMERLGMTYRRSYQEQWQPKDLPVTFRLYQIDF